MFCDVFQIKQMRRVCAIHFIHNKNKRFVLQNIIPATGSIGSPIKGVMSMHL